jgi:hypothetical protein
MSQYRRTNNDDLPLLLVQLLAETCICRRPHLVAWVVKATIPLSMAPFSRHKDNGLDGRLEFGRDMCKFTSRVKEFEVEFGIIRQA